MNTDWKFFCIVFFLTYFSLVFILNQPKGHLPLQIDGTTLKYHSNWTASLKDLPALRQFQQALKIIAFEHLDISLANSKLQPSFVYKIFTFPFPGDLQTVKLNLGSLSLGINQIQYLLSLIPYRLKKLQVNMDSNSFDSGFGMMLAYQMNKFSLLEQLKISLLVSVPHNQEEIGIFFKLHKPRTQLKILNLVLVGNKMKPEHLSNLPQYLAKFNLTSFQFNLYANSIGQKGANYIYQALQTQNYLQYLSIDLYFNEIGENGTKYITEQISKFKHLKTLSLNFDFNYIKNDGGKFVGNMLATLEGLEQLEIGVATKNFGYLGFKQVIDGMKKHTGLKKLTLRCGVNRVGINGAKIVKDMLEGMKDLEYLDLGFIENYVGDEGLTLLSESIAKIPSLKSLQLNLGFNGAQSYGLINTFKAFAQKSYDHLFIGLSNNQFRDRDVSLITKYLNDFIKQNKQFELDFYDTAISKQMASQIKRIFLLANQKHNKKSEISVNSIIPDEQKPINSAEKKAPSQKSEIAKQRNSGQAEKQAKESLSQNSQEASPAGNRNQEPDKSKTSKQKS